MEGNCHDISMKECHNDQEYLRSLHTNCSEKDGGEGNVDNEPMSSFFSEEKWKKMSDLLSKLNLTLVPIHKKNQKRISEKLSK